MKIINLIIGLTFTYLNMSGQNLEEFNLLLNECGMTATIPEGFIESEIIENNDMNYEYSVKYPNKNFELRYSIRPISYKNYTNEEVKRELESQKGFRNSSYKLIFKTIILNITGGVEYEINEFDHHSVKKEFSADWGGTTFVELNSDFGKGYQYCMIVGIHKKDTADAYFFYLANSKVNFSEYMKPLFHSLHFD